VARAKVWVGGRAVSLPVPRRGVRGTVSREVRGRAAEAEMKVEWRKEEAWLERGKRMMPGTMRMRPWTFCQT